MSIETVSEEGQADYEIWSCDNCGYSITLSGVGTDVSDCPRCLQREAEEECKSEEIQNTTAKDVINVMKKYILKYGQDNSFKNLKQFIYELETCGDFYDEKGIFKG